MDKRAIGAALGLLAGLSLTALPALAAPAPASRPATTQAAAAVVFEAATADDIPAAQEAYTKYLVAMANGDTATALGMLADPGDTGRGTELETRDRLAMARLAAADAKLSKTAPPKPSTAASFAAHVAGLKFKAEGGRIKGEGVLIHVELGKVGGEFKIVAFPNVPRPGAGFDEQKLTYVTACEAILADVDSGKIKTTAQLMARTREARQARFGRPPAPEK